MLAAPAYSADAPKTGATAQQRQTQQAATRNIRASNLMGKDVRNAQGEDLGEIKDVVVNIANGSVRYAVLEFDKSWSMADKLLTFPVSSFKQGAKPSDDLVLSASRDTLDRVPGFDKNRWPDLNDPK